jgi:DNA repair protein RadC
MEMQKARCVEDAVALLMLRKKPLRREAAYAIFLGKGNSVLGIRELCRGRTRRLAFPARKLFRLALINGARSVILAHTHPSGEIAPSKKDIAATRRLARIGKILGVSVADHIILGKNALWSRVCGWR